MDITLDIGPTVNAILWPLVALIILLLYKDQIIAILPNIKKLSLPGVEIELGIAKEYRDLDGYDPGYKALEYNRNPILIFNTSTQSCAW